MKRSYEAELIDLGPNYYSKEEYIAWLYQMGRIGKLLGGNRATLKALKKLKEKPKSILEVGCGGGIFTQLMAQEFKEASILGIDISKDAIEFAKENSKKKSLKNLSFEIRQNPELCEKPKSFDIVTATLLCHHLNDENLIEFLKKAGNVARKAIIINDLHRNWIAYTGFKILSRLIFRNRLVCNDGPLSIKKGFMSKDWKYYLTSAGYSKSQFKISWHYLFRWIIVVEL